MKTTKKKPSEVRETFPAPIVASGPTLFHPEFRAYTQGRMPFPHEIDFYAMFDMAVRLDGDEKWVVNAKLTATLDKHNHNKADIAGEVKAVIPAVACSGAVYIDGAGNLMTPKEAVKQLSMFQYDARRAA